MIAIVDYGLGNLGSIANMLRKIGAKPSITSDPIVLQDAEKIILPGVGAFDTGMHHLIQSGLLDILNRKALIERVPVLGICLGAQMMTESSEEGTSKGLGWFKARTLKFDFSKIPGKWPLPNIGWRDVVDVGHSRLLAGFDEVPRFYFVHAYYMKPDTDFDEIVSMKSSYGIEYVCGLSNDNLHCVQFHPEKSHKFGMQLLRNFTEMK